MTKLTLEEFNRTIRLYTRGQLLDYIRSIVVIRPAGRKPEGSQALTNTEKNRRYRERLKRRSLDKVNF